MPRHHVVISGPGRSGTSFFVHFLTALGLDTGFDLLTVKTSLSPVSRAGLEKDIRRSDSPYIVKSPHFCDYVEEVAASSEIIVDHVFILIRDLKAAADSRRRVSSRGEKNGGLWGVSSMQPGIQESFLAVKTYSLIESLSRNRVSFSVLNFPLIIEDHNYLFDSISCVWPNLSREASALAWSQVVERPSQLKSLP